MLGGWASPPTTLREECVCRVRLACVLFCSVLPGETPELLLYPDLLNMQISYNHVPFMVKNFDNENLQNRENQTQK